MNLKNISLLLTLIMLILPTSNYAESVYTQIESKSIAFFAEQLGVESSEVKILFKRRPINLEKYVHHHIEIISKKRVVNAGTQAIWVEFSNSAKVLKKIPLSIEVWVVKEILVANKRIRRGQEITTEDVTFLKKNMGKDWRDHFFNIKDLKSAQAKQLIKNGLPIKKRMVKPVPLIKNGQTIKVALVSKLLKVSTAGIAKQDGVFGQTIRVRLNSTGRQISGVVKSNNIIEVSME